MSKQQIRNCGCYRNTTKYGFLAETLYPTQAILKPIKGLSVARYVSQVKLLRMSVWAFIYCRCMSFQLAPVPKEFFE